MKDAPFLRPFAATDADWLIDRHQALYAQEEGYDQNFGPLVRKIVQGYLSRADAAREAGWIVTRGDERLGSIFCMAEGADSPDLARLRLFLLEPHARGTGLAQRMIDTCLHFARAAGYRRMRLWTHASHIAACRLYERNGFHCTEVWAERSFGRDVVSQIWERDISVQTPLAIRAQGG